jgi:hypothetical protein
MSHNSDTAWLRFEQLAFEYHHCNAVRLTLELFRWQREQRRRLSKRPVPLSFD